MTCLMTLFPEIDKEKTKKEVRELLTCYRSMIRIAGDEYVPKVTATYSLELKCFTGQVSCATENAVVRKITAEQELVKIAKAMNRLNAYDRQMIYDRYMNKMELTNTAIYLDYKMSERTFYRELDKALLRFAEAYENGSLLAEKWQ